MNEQSHGDSDLPHESSCSGAGSDGPWDEWDEWDALARGFPDEHVWDAFELDDALEEPEPEYGDFWLDADDEEEVAE